MTSSELSPPPTERQPLDAGVIRVGTLSKKLLLEATDATAGLYRRTRRGGWRPVC
jgi:hypothetical protein